jgi:hypothetical protein
MRCPLLAKVPVAAGEEKVGRGVTVTVETGWMAVTVVIAVEVVVVVTVLVAAQAGARTKNPMKNTVEAWLHFNIVFIGIHLIRIPPIYHIQSDGG